MRLKWFKFGLWGCRGSQSRNYRWRASFHRNLHSLLPSSQCTVPRFHRLPLWSLRSSRRGSRLSGSTSARDLCGSRCWPIWPTLSAASDVVCGRVWLTLRRSRVRTWRIFVLGRWWSGSTLVRFRTRCSVWGWLRFIVWVLSLWIRRFPGCFSSVRLLVDFSSSGTVFRGIYAVFRGWTSSVPWWGCCLRWRAWWSIWSSFQLFWVVFFSRWWILTRRRRLFLRWLLRVSRMKN